jgi:hypothetical protein
MGETFGPEGPEQPGWDWFWEQFRRHRSPPMRPRRVPPPDDGEKLRRARIRKAALELVRALTPGDESLERADYAGALLGVQELIDDLDLCVTCRRNEWECACGAEHEDEGAAPDDGFGMDRVVLTALDHAGIALPTFWGGETAECRRVRVIVGPPPIDGWWSAPLTGQVRDAVEVTAEGRTFYIDDQDGTGWAHVTVRQGDPMDPRPTLPVKRVIGVREPEPRATLPAAQADVYAALAVRSGVPVERVRQFFEGATPEQVKRMMEPGEAPSATGGGRDPIPLHSRKPAAPAPVREPAAPAPAPAPARKGRRERIRSACRDLIDVYHEPRIGATDRELLEEAAKVIERERNALKEE